MTETSNNITIVSYKTVVGCLFRFLTLILLNFHGNQPVNKKVMVV